MYNILFSKENYYPYLRSNPEHPTKNLEDAITNNKEELTNTSIIIKNRANNMYRIFQNYKHFSEAFPEDTIHCCDEVILECQYQRPKYDIDDWKDEDEEVLSDIFSTIENYYNHCLHVHPEMVVCDSSGHDSVLNRHKNSCHIIITNYVVKGSDAKIISDAIYNQLSADSQPYFDRGVNKSIQNFRTPLSTKNGRQKQVPGNYTRMDAMISQGISKSPITILRAPTKVANKANNNTKAVINTDINKILLQASTYITGWLFRKRHHNTLYFNRTANAATYCKFCQRDHTADNTLCLTISPAGVYLGCLKSPQRELIMHPEKPTLANIINNPPIPRNYINELNFVLSNQYTEPVMQQFPDHRTLYVRANMKMGKTNAAIDYMRSTNSKRIVILSFRKTFTHEKLAALKEFGFRTYNNLKNT